MTTRSDVDAFLALTTIAVAGVSRSARKFGSVVFRDLRARGYTVVPLHPQLPEYDGVPCYHTISAAPPGIEGLVTVVPPAETERVVREAAGAGVRHVWMQQGSESPAAVAFCREQGMNVVHDQCILMFASPTGIVHRVHRWVNGKLGKLPG
jgi:hypothetical protein